MARPRPARVAKRSPGRLGRRLIAGAANTATTPVIREAAVDTMDTSGDRLELEGDGSMQDPGTGLTTDTEEEEVMVVDSQDCQPSPPRQDKGKGRAVDVKEERHFAFMELPTELRLEIYRACLTRPCKVLLSKTVEPSPEPAEELYREHTQAELAELDPTDVGFYSDHPGAVPVLSRWEAMPAAIRPRHFSAVAGPTVRARNHPRALNRLTRPVVPRRRQSSAIRLFPDNVALPVASSSNANGTGHVAVQSQQFTRPGPGRPPMLGVQSQRPRKNVPSSAFSRPKNDDPLIVNILRTNKTVYKEARAVLYNENIFDLSIGTAVSSLAALHQRSRRLIRHVELEIPSYTEIQDKFGEVVRLSLRYCSGLRKLVIHTPFYLPGGDGSATPNSNVQIWAQGFDILRWLPQQCDVVLMGNKNAEIEEVVNKHLHLAKTLTPVSIPSYIR